MAWCLLQCAKINAESGLGPVMPWCKVYKPNYKPNYKPIEIDATGEPSARGWQAELSLMFQADDRGRTILSHCRHSGPLQVQRPFYPEPASGACHVYILHPPGGIVGGDGLRVQTLLQGKARVLLTTPAAGKFYRSAGGEAQLVQRFKVASDAVLEWLPQENIFYKGARVRATTHIDVQDRGCYIGWEIGCLGRPASGEFFSQGICRQNLEIWRAGEPLFLEHGRFEGGGELLEAAWGLHGNPVFGTLVCVSPISGLDVRVRDAVTVSSGDGFAVTQMDGVLVCRYLGNSAQKARILFTQAWAVLRPLVIGIPACAPRIWNV